MKILKSDSKLIILTVFCLNMVILSPALTVFGTSSESEENKSDIDRINDKYDDFNNETYVSIKYKEIQSNNNKTEQDDNSKTINYEIELDRENNIKHIVKKDTQAYECYIDYARNKKYYKTSEKDYKSTSLKDNGEYGDFNALYTESNEAVNKIKLMQKHDGYNDISYSDDQITFTDESDCRYEISLYDNGKIKTVRETKEDNEIAYFEFSYENKIIEIPSECLNSNDNQKDNNESEETVEKQTEENVDNNKKNQLENYNAKIIIIAIAVVGLVLVLIIIVVLIRKNHKKEKIEQKFISSNKKQNSVSISKISHDNFTDDKDGLNTADKSSGLNGLGIYNIRFTVIKDDKKKEEQHYELKKGENVIVGRSDMSGVVIEDPLLSRQHFVIISEYDNLYIEDLETTNGTMVNDEKIDGRYKLSKRDAVSAGNYTIRIDW
ncbi:MAG: FHA domain-containing protein [Lachnospiraceae bacterium]|nr:FHA domain-containing protein [Lachnospiraceae bacterium]